VRHITMVGVLAALVMFRVVEIVHASGVLPETVNQIMLYTRVNEREPVFYAIFSEKPIGKSIRRQELQSLLVRRDRRDILVLKLHGKPVEKGSRISYFFGTAYDQNMPWNDGKEFDWRSWSDYSADIWDHIAVAYDPPANKRSKTRVSINQVVIRRGGKVLLDTRVTESYPNKKRISTKLPTADLFPARLTYPVLSLGACMSAFRTDYYEITGDILQTAYADLGQTDKRKYATRGDAWCSEYASHVLRANGIETPDPNGSDVYWKNLREYFEASGRVYTSRDVASWPDSKKSRVIKPGSVVSFFTNEGRTTHTVLFTTWIRDGRNPISGYTGISGCNRGMVWAHAPLPLPPKDWAKDRTPEEIADFDSKCFFGVPR
jgi:hypothetical protein